MKWGGGRLAINEKNVLEAVSLTTTNDIVIGFYVTDYIDLSFVPRRSKFGKYEGNL
jgi:hypothetical protein